MNLPLSPQQRFEALSIRRSKTELAELETLLDALPAVTEDFMLGDWNGGVFITGHPGETNLPKIGWVGKTFHSRTNVDPVVCRGPGGTRVPYAPLGKAQLRRVEYRGVVSATLVFDSQPIFDYLRYVDHRTVMGVMDRKGLDMPLYFYLRRTVPGAL